MSTQIEWTHANGFLGETWNPLAGCGETSPGCLNCYAARIAHRGMSKQHKGLTKLHVLSDGSKRITWNGKVNYVFPATTKPIRWRKKRMVFVGSMTDLFYKEMKDDWLDRIFAATLISLIHDRAPGHIFQFLTKRPKRAAEYVSAPDLAGRLAREAGQMMEDGDNWHDTVGNYIEEHGLVHRGIWMGTSAEDQKRWNERVPVLVHQVPAAIHFVSAEPLLGPIDLRATGRMHLDWLITGAESGNGARPCDDDWFRTLRDQCVENDIPFFLKQKAEKGHKISTPELDGERWVQFPEVTT